MDAYTLTKLKVQTLPHTNALSYQLRGAGSLPSIAVTLGSVLAKYNKGIDLTTKGEFGQALDVFRYCLQSVPLAVVTNKDQAKELQEIIRKSSEYITAMRIELERKRLVSAGSTDNARITELGCYMTLCAMDLAHKFLAYKNAMNTNYKM